MRAMTPDESIMDDQDDDDEKQHFKEGKRYQPESEDYEEYVENLEQNQHFYKGSDAWCRYHFKNYLIHMLRCSFMEGKFFMMMLFSHNCFIQLFV